jgi:ribonuclease HI
LTEEAGGNPGPAGIGVVVVAADGTPLVTLGRFIGRATNNVAEYRALITAMAEALKLGAKRVIIRGDSELIIKPGEYRVKNPDMKVLYDQARALIVQFEKATIEHNLRHKNALADTLANLAMDRRVDVTEVPGVGKSLPQHAEAESSPLDEPSPEGTIAGDGFACARCGCSIEVLKPSGIRPHQLKAFVCQCGAKMERFDVR